MLTPIKIQSRTPAAIQLTAEQIVLESVSRVKDRPRLIGQNMNSEQENADLIFRRRQAWEQSVRRNLCTHNTFIRYAIWEEQNGEIENARNVFERALKFTEYKEQTVWNCYVDMELRHKQFNYARNLYERAVTLLPRYDEFWLRYAQLEISISNFENARKIFQRWLAWEPPAHAFLTFVEFETKLKEFSRARSVFERLLIIHPFPESYLRYADFEIRLHQSGRARSVFERGLNSFGEKNLGETFLIKFAEFEEDQGEIDRARAIYKLGLSKLPETSSHDIYPAYLQFEKRFGGNTQIEDAVIDKKRAQYKQFLDQNPNDYDTWFELCQLLVESSRIDEARMAFTDAESHKPPVVDEKEQWSKYVQVCLQHAIFEEKVAKNYDNAREAYRKLISTVPNKKFTFSRMWILYAFFEVRQENIQMARDIFGTALGICKKYQLKCCSIYRSYIEMEGLLQNFDKVRKLYQDFIEKEPQFLLAWTRFAMFEVRRGNEDSAREILEKAVNCEYIEEKDLIWSTYIDFESHIGNLEKVSQLYQNLTETSNKFETWRDWISFEAGTKGKVDYARQLFSLAEEKMSSDKLSRAKIRKLRVEFEEEFGDEETRNAVDAALPKEIDGELVFPEEGEDAARNLLEAAAEWNLEEEK
ncbi:Crooked neck protein-related protein [Trichomonas vaginalis G3]|uniref:Crooked neck protein-related protein n=1 Tax=Trichomonas vaginalis (strain ATCC PRA-98 / G3) TaxID=412133 RepID=A2EJ46_TRIV3|nr:pre-mRNA splicing factor family [Trichomonas vaginalis G3]EAY07349.1 Crooked neck protein-related protein [Trichomonas vaginalis G3]KAI5524522.1 pre-mRNA splicing factor family [Trichomonas vaginalis G3]|eukprot:XP_001319572.1 Crooked neck protein-related protein [Trichomonas vaginalis G3]